MHNLSKYLTLTCIVLTIIFFGLLVIEVWGGFLTNDMLLRLSLTYIVIMIAIGLVIALVRDIHKEESFTKDKDVL